MFKAEYNRDWLKNDSERHEFWTSFIYQNYPIINRESFIDLKRTIR